MHLLIPYHRYRDCIALDAACHLAHSGDMITVLSSAIVPADYPVDVIPGAIWKQTCTADRCLAHARAYLAPRVESNVKLCILRVQARDECTAIVAGTQDRAADLILFAGWPPPFARVAARFGTAAIVARHVRCGVHVVPARQPPTITADARLLARATGERGRRQTVLGDPSHNAKRA